MKTIIKTSALFLGLALLSTGAFAAYKTTEAPKAAANLSSSVVFTSLSESRGVRVIVHQAIAANAAVKIYDAAGHVLRSDKFAKNVITQKGYDLTQLEDGNYTIEVTANGQITKKVVHVYNDENDQRSFFFITE